MSASITSDTFFRDKRTKFVSGIPLFILFSAFTCCTVAKQKSEAGPMEIRHAVPVTVAIAEKGGITTSASGPGVVTGYNTVTIRSRVDGQVVKMAFHEGQKVREGDLLFLIDPRPYEAIVNQSVANLFRDQAALADAKVTLQRCEALYAAGVIAKQQLDTQQTAFQQLEGSVRADQAQVESAKLNLAYTRITSPLDGSVGLRLIDVGNVVHASDPNGLVVITQLNPIAVLFVLPEQSLASVVSSMREGRSVIVDAFTPDDLTKLGSGRLVAVDNEVDPSIGMPRLKAVFNNQQGKLWPNESVNVRLVFENHSDNVIIPSAAVQRDSRGTFVYTVRQDDTVNEQIVLVTLTQGGRAVIGRGLRPGDVVVTDSLNRLQTGAMVQARNRPQPQPPAVH